MHQLSQSLSRTFGVPFKAAPAKPKASALPFQCIPRPTGTGERNDCCVRALANATGLDYLEAHVIAARYGRPDRSRMPHRSTVTMFDAYGTRQDLVEKARGHVIERPAYRGGSYVRVTKVGRVTLARFLAAYPRGTYVCHIRGHVFAVRDGVVLDNNEPKPRQLVDTFWTIVPA